MSYTSYLVKQKLGLRRFDPETRAELAHSFRAMYRNLGLDLPGCAKLLHVTERTLHNWESGKHEIPYAAYRLLRLLNRMELPGDAWAGWCFYGGALVSPEGHSFYGTQANWWTNVIRRSELFVMYSRRNKGVDGAARMIPTTCEAGVGARGEAPRPPAAAGGRREAPALDLSHKHFGTLEFKNPANAASFAIKSVAYKVAA